MKSILSFITVAFAFSLWFAAGYSFARRNPSDVIKHYPCATNNIVMLSCPKAKDMTDAVGLSDKSFWDTIIASVDGRVTILTNVQSRTWHKLPNGLQCLVVGFGHTTNELHFRITGTSGTPNYRWLQQ
jgi:hypothetical protein